jgi:hypothetical protein
MSFIQLLAASTCKIQQKDQYFSLELSDNKMGVTFNDNSIYSELNDFCLFDNLI